jgi:dihydroorotase
MNESITSTLLGMKGMPGIAEEVMVKRDLELLKYAGGKIHFANISTAASLKQIAKAKQSGLNVTCDVAAYSLLFEDNVLMDYDTNYKVNPPLRSKKDINALLKGLASDDIDVLVSAHTPHDEECKKLEFDLADFGMLGLQTFLPMVLESTGRDIERILDKFTTNPRSILGLPTPEIKEGEKAELTIFNTEQEWMYDENTNLSKSVNSPWLGKKLKGAVVGVVGNGRSFFNDF